MLRFVLLQGMVGWGLSVGVVWFAAMSVYARCFWGEPEGFSMWSWLPFTLAMFSAAGAVCGVCMWPLILWLHARLLKARAGGPGRSLPKDG